MQILFGPKINGPCKVSIQIKLTTICCNREKATSTLNYSYIVKKVAMSQFLFCFLSTRPKIFIDHFLRNHEKYTTTQMKP